MLNPAVCRWEERWEHLQLILEVYQFARDAAVAEAWLMAQVNTGEPIQLFNRKMLVNLSCDFRLSNGFNLI